MSYKVNFGYDKKGRPRNRYYATIDEAKKAVNAHFCRTGVVLSIEAGKRK